MIVLSVCDGMSCGQIALYQLGIIVDKYFASEIKPHAIKVVKNNFPNTIHVGDMTKISYSNGILKTEFGEYNIGTIDLLIGGTPCQDLSILMSDRKGLEGDKSSLFWEYVRIKEEAKPRFFMLENVGSMSVEDSKTITRALGVDGVRINSSLVSAQLRDRIYWTNIPGDDINLFGDPRISQPEDMNIKLQDILESGTTDRDKALCLTARGGGRWSHIVNDDKHKSDKVQKQLLKRNQKGFDNVVFDDGYYRLLTVKEQERLQTVPEGYMDILDYVDASNLLGDGWTIKAVEHIFKQLKYIF